MADVTMPKLSDTMEEGKILRWLKQAGDQVAVGDLLVEVETDKADMEVEASAAGVLREVKLVEGESAAVGAVIAVIDGAGGDAKSTPKGDGTPPKKEAAPAKPQAAKAPAKEVVQDATPEPAEKRPAQKGTASSKPAAEAPPAKEKQAAAPEAEAAPEPEDPAVPESKPRPTGEPTDAAAHRAAGPARGVGAVKASPLARALATELGVELASVRGTGPAGRITRHDVEQAAARGAEKQPAKADAAAHPAARRAEAAAPTKDEAAAKQPAPDGEPADATDRTAASVSAEVRRVPLSKMRASIAKRMSESMREAPHFYLTTVVDMDEAVRLRAQLKALEVSRAGVTYNHMVLKAVAGALAEHPEINARFAGDAIELDPAINLGIATAVEDGLIVPVLAGADRLSLLEIAERARALAEKAESGRFSSADLSGATFSVSNLGMFEVDSFSAVINPPQAAILAVGSVKQRPVARDGALAVGYTMAMTLSCDHRVIDGARGGRFLAEVKRRLENPVALLLDDEASA